MTVQELINKLNKIEDKTQLVLMSKDEEGNDFKELETIEINYLTKRYGYSYELYDIEEIINELTEEGYKETNIEEELKSYAKCICLWP